MRRHPPPHVPPPARRQRPGAESLGAWRTKSIVLSASASSFRMIEPVGTSRRQITSSASAVCAGGVEAQADKSNATPAVSIAVVIFMGLSLHTHVREARERVEHAPRGNEARRLTPSLILRRAGAAATQRVGNIRAMLRPSLAPLPASRIREVANAAIGRGDVLKFWFGEGDLPTPAFIREAAKAALDEGETFYNHNLGIVELRESIAGYVNRLHAPRVAVDADRIAVTSSGVSALSLVAQSLFAPGDRVAIVTPVWPNVTAQPRIMSAEVIRVPLECTAGRWRLDLQRLLDAAAPGTRAVIVNSPNNPTGWVMPQGDWNALLAHCRRHGIWLVADDAYERLAFDGDTHAPGVLEQVDPAGWWRRAASSPTSPRWSSSTPRARRPSSSAPASPPSSTATA